MICPLIPQDKLGFNDAENTFMHRICIDELLSSFKPNRNLFEKYQGLVYGKNPLWQKLIQFSYNQAQIGVATLNIQYNLETLLI